ncbi:MAG: helix-turn-helix domain-containing protein [Treponema sp.]|jgi:AraC family transcriptional regulator|nr:helix-turn-helix domain-containing protein [Treponema sp.]
MLKPYELLENILQKKEKGINDNINASVLSKKYGFSEGHLRRLFSFAFKQSIASYIRSRRLAASLNDILERDFNILDIALEYGFEYEQSYIRAFKHEFGLTPGDLRKTGQIIKIKPPLHLFDENKLDDDNVFFGPDIVMVPSFFIIGKHHRIPLEHSIDIVPQIGRQFWENEREQIKGVVNPHIYIGLARNINNEEGLEYITSVQAKNMKNIPNGFYGDTFETSICAKFRYIGQHHYYDINKNLASMMDNAIINFAQNKNTKYELLNDKIHFERIDTCRYDGTYCQIEWYAPVSEKQ